MTISNGQSIPVYTRMQQTIVFQISHVSARDPLRVVMRERRAQVVKLENADVEGVARVDVDGAWQSDVSCASRTTAHVTKVSHALDHQGIVPCQLE
jgi:hypothetical protein